MGYNNIPNDDAEGIVKVQTHHTYWFEDGSLILHVEDSLFKVHSTVLCRHSPYFASEVPTTVPKHLQAVLSDPNQYGYLLVGRGARIVDVETLLQHIYHDVPLDSSRDFVCVASMLRISSPQQLDFPQIHLLAKILFTNFFLSGPAPFSHPEHLSEALELASEFNILSAQKGLLYSLVTTTHFETEEIADDSAAPLGSKAVDPPMHTSFAVATTSDPQLSILSYANVKLCQKLMNDLISHFTPILFTPAATPHMACTDVFADTWMALVIQPALEDDGVYKPLETLERMKNINWAELGLCPSCVIEKREEWTNEQADVWLRMDTWLGIETKAGAADV